MKSRTALIIGYVWPEPGSSAAGFRTWNLIHALQQGGWEVVFSSPSRENEHAAELRKAGIRAETHEANDSGFDRFIGGLKPGLVLFDRFVIEEQFGWRVRDHSPDSIRVLDTQDLHFLRRARKRAVDEGVPLEKVYRADFPLRTEDALREVAAIYRCDLTLLVSGYEKELLESRLDVPSSLLMKLGFAYPNQEREVADFGERGGFVMIGNFRHPPNWDGVLWFRREIWPGIRSRLPGAQVRIYGAYPSREAIELRDTASGFLVEGWAQDQYQVLSNHRVNLAPLRFGAGIKGKISDGWAVGTPAVTTPIGYEGMHDSGDWGGEVARTPQEFVEKAVMLHESSERWSAASVAGRRLLRELFDAERFAVELNSKVDELGRELASRRELNFVGAMLWHHMHKSTTYFSRWIELKNRLSSSI